MLAAFILMLAPLSVAAEPRTLRLDYFHAGGATEERFAREAVVVKNRGPGIRTDPSTS